MTGKHYIFAFLSIFMVIGIYKITQEEVAIYNVGNRKPIAAFSLGLGAKDTYVFRTHQFSKEIIINNLSEQSLPLDFIMFMKASSFEVEAMDVSQKAPKDVLVFDTTLRYKPAFVDPFSVLLTMRLVGFKSNKYWMFENAINQYIDE